jgi:hypothetical protein
MARLPARDCPPERRARVVLVAVVHADDNRKSATPPVGTSFILDHSPFYFGLTRCLPDPERDVALFVEGLTRAHLSFELRDDRWWVRDNASTNGTWIDGARITRRKLTDGTRVTLGPLGDPREPGGTGVTLEFHDARRRLVQDGEVLAGG